MPGQKAKDAKDKVIIVKVARSGEQTRSIEVKPGAKVADALSKAEIKVESLRLQVNGQSATVNTVLKDGDTITLVPKIKGG